MKLFLFTLALFSAEVFGFDAKPLDELVQKNCALQSPPVVCKGRMGEIRKDLTVEKLIEKSPKLEIDSQIDVVLARDPQTMISNYYCVARLNGLIPRKGFDLELFAYAVRGLTFGPTTEKTYAKWLGSVAAKDCKFVLVKESLSPWPVTFKKPYTIVLNPVAMLDEGADENFFAMTAQTYNHERLHVLYAVEKAEKKILKFWDSLTKAQQAQFKSEHSSYDFKDKSILAREFFSYTFETHPEKGAEFLQGKYKPASYTALMADLCTFCVRNDEALLEKMKALAALSPKELVSKVESEGVKVLILSSGRKNPSPLFNWSKERADKGEMKQITKESGAMGETLCKGDKLESADRITIVLATDSPYSTLLHEYLHVQQIQRDGSWCAIAKRLWSKPERTPFEQRMSHDREWDGRMMLWKLMETPHITLEDRIMLVDGFIREADARPYDPEAAAFVKNEDLNAKRDLMVREYLKLVAPVTKDAPEN